MKNYFFDPETFRSIKEQELSISEDGKTLHSCLSMTLERVVIPEGITAIGPKAFQGFCYHLHSAKLPATITSIAPGALGRLQEIEFAPSNPFFYQDQNGVLFADQGKTLLWFPREGGPEYTIPEGVTTIAQEAFHGCGHLTSLTIPDNVVRIGESAFCGCCSLKKIELPANLREIAYGTFEACSSMETITIPQSVTSIGIHVFFDCHNLQNVIIPDSVVSIGAQAFAWCEKLKNVKLPAGITEIDNGMFEYCESLESIIIPGKVTKIDRDAFNGAGCEKQLERDYPHLFHKRSRKKRPQS